MRARTLTMPVAAVAFASCAAGMSSPPALAYRLPSETQVSYTVTDTAVISIQALGQGLDLDVGSRALYSLSFARADDGVTVTLSVADLAATVGMPLVGPMEVDESGISGNLVFTLDRRGEATLVSRPELDEAVSQLVPPLQIAHSFFPALPGTVVSPGDSWTDTTSFEDDGSAGSGVQHTILAYTVAGDTVVENTSLLVIEFRGTSDVSQTLSLQGAQVEQSTRLDLEGHVLWDAQRGLMFERESLATGTGTVRVATMPAAMPTRFQSRQRVRIGTE